MPTRCGRRREAGRDAKAIDPPTLAAIESAYPDSRITLHPVWRVLVFVLGVRGDLRRSLRRLFQRSLGRAWGRRRPRPRRSCSRPRGSGVPRYPAPGPTPPRRFWPTCSLSSPQRFSSLSGGTSTTTRASISFSAFSCLLAALFAWRWGFWFVRRRLGGQRLPAGRAHAGRARPLDRPLPRPPRWRPTSSATERAIAPPHRRSLAAVFVVSAAALYAAVNLYASGPFLDRGDPRRLFATPARSAPAPGRAADSRGARDGGVSRRLPGLGNPRAPRASPRIGDRFRRALGRDASATTSRSARAGRTSRRAARSSSARRCGSHRRLRDAAGGAWRGLTAAPLYSGDDAGISPLGALGAHVAVPAAPEPERPGFTGGGGEYGGGGASGQY